MMRKLTTYNLQLTTKKLRTGVSKITALFLILSFAFLIFPNGALARGPLEPPCSGAGCTVCHALAFLQQIIDFMRDLSFIIGLVVFAFAAILYMLGDSAKQIGIPGSDKNPKDMMMNVIKGIALIALSWTIVTVLVAAISGQDVIAILKGIEFNCSI